MENTITISIPKEHARLLVNCIEVGAGGDNITEAEHDVVCAIVQSIESQLNPTKLHNQGHTAPLNEGDCPHAIIIEAQRLADPNNMFDAAEFERLTNSIQTCLNHIVQHRGSFVSDTKPKV